MGAFNSFVILSEARNPSGIAPGEERFLASLRMTRLSFLNAPLRHVFSRRCHPRTPISQLAAPATLMADWCSESRSRAVLYAASPRAPYGRVEVDWI